MVDEVMIESAIWTMSLKIVVRAATCEVAAPSIRSGMPDLDGRRPTCGLRQLVVAFAETLQAHRETDPFLGRLEDDEGRGLARAQLLDQIIVHDHLGDAAIRQTADESGATDVDL